MRESAVVFDYSVCPLATALSRVAFRGLRVVSETWLLDATTPTGCDGRLTSSMPPVGF